ncbi:hypothetical protein SSX86_010161 [Deinandra increscens subsp. villosa]|uniref:Mitochondrial phosphate carrier protein n=1 Tax=Deinandra increscens subsp. villosa TaxID=3103831 RepID=A0AAP0H4P6_9ASTR
MAVSGDSRRQSLIPNFLYTSSVSPVLNHGGFRRLSYSPMLNHSNTLFPSTSPANQQKNFMIPAPDEPNCMNSRGFYALCTLGGIFRCGIPRVLYTPFDLVKCNMQIHPANFDSIWFGIVGLLKEQGVRGLYTGWVPTLVGYSVHGACLFGFYEFFKKYYSEIAGPEYATKYKTLIYLAGSASAEAIATVALCPFEAVKVRAQTQPGFARGLRDGLPKFIKSEGALGLYKGLVPLWGRQIPYTVMQFAAFERIGKMLYKYLIPTPKNECSPHLKLNVSFAAGHVTAVLCAIVSHPADTLFSFLNNSKGATVREAAKKFGVWGVSTRGILIRMIISGPLIGGEWGTREVFSM